MSLDGQGTKWHGNITENFNRLSRAHERCRRQTDLFTTTYMYISERECEFMFAKIRRNIAEIISGRYGYRLS